MKKERYLIMNSKQLGSISLVLSAVGTVLGLVTSVIANKQTAKLISEEVMKQIANQK